MAKEKEDKKAKEKENKKAEEKEKDKKSKSSEKTSKDKGSKAATPPQPSTPSSTSQPTTPQQKEDVKVPAETKTAEKSKVEPSNVVEKPTEVPVTAAATGATTAGASAQPEPQPPKPVPKIRLTYFNGAGRAELSRLILAAAGLEFEDRRLEAAEWAEMKPGTPFSQVPLLEYHGETLGQSITIARFLAKKTGMYGKDDLEQANVDAIVDYVADYNNKWVAVFRANIFEERAELIYNIFKNFLPLFFKNLQELLKKAGGQYFAGGKMTMADISVFQILHAFTDPEDPFFVTLPYVDERFTFLDGYPLLVELKERVGSVSGIQTWVQNRPKGLF